MADSLITTARQKWLVVKNERNKKANTAERVGGAGLAVCDAVEYAVPYIGANGNWYIGGADTGRPSAGSSVPPSAYFTKQGINGEVFPTPFKWTENLKIKSALVMSNANGFTCTIAGTQYNQTTAAGANLPAGTELILTDIDIKAGQNQGNVLILFQKI